MKYRYAGRSGLLVSRACLGTMTFGTDNWGCDEEHSIRIIDAFIDAGGTFIDTADIYSGSRSEEIIGKALAGGKRDGVVLATKGFFRTGAKPTDKGNSRKHLIAACEASLLRLKTDYIDIYYIHGPDHYTRWDETMRTLDDLVRHGKVRSIGCSNVRAWEFVKANGISDKLGLERFAIGQYMYNLIRRDVETDVLPACRDQEMGFTAWSPLGGGLLTGKYRRSDKPEEGSRLHYRQSIDGPRFWTDRGHEAAGKVADVAAKTGIPAARLALAWLLANKSVTSVIIGVRSEEQLAENLASADWDMSADIHEELCRETEFDRGSLSQFYDQIANTLFVDHER